MYSLENEMWGPRMNDEAPAKKNLIRMGQLVKRLDPTRLITYESDIDPGGVADVIGLHYPHEYPDYHDWPNTAYWMDDPIVPMGFTEGRKRWQWRRNKPLYIGEFLWCPLRTPQANTILFGQEAFTDFRRMRERAKAITWRWQIEAYRWYGVSGMCPWTLSESIGSAWRTRLDVRPEANLLYRPRSKPTGRWPPTPPRSGPAPTAGPRSAGPGTSTTTRPKSSGCTFVPPCRFLGAKMGRSSAAGSSRSRRQASANCPGRSPCQRWKNARGPR